MTEKSVRKPAVRLKEASGQFSSQSHELFSRKCLYKESDPEILAYPPKKIGKIKQKCGITPFFWGQHVCRVSNNIIEWFPHKKKS